MIERKLEEILEDARKFKELTLQERIRQRNDAKQNKLRDRIKKVANTARTFNCFLKRRKFRKLQAFLVVIGLVIFSVCLEVLDELQRVLLAVVILFISLNLIRDRWRYRKIRALLRDCNIRLFTRLFAPTTLAERGTKWLKPSEICDILEKKYGCILKANEMGRSLTKICLKNYRKYLVQCY